MHIINPYWKAAVFLLAFVAAVGCSKQSTETDAEPAVATRKMTAEIDKMCEEALRSSEIREAADWVKRYPKSAVGEDEEGRAIPLSTFVTRFQEAGAQRVVIQFAKLGQAEFLVAMIVVLPTESAARQKLFAMDAPLSQLCQQTPVTDRGQKYLHYSFD